MEKIVSFSFEIEYRPSEIKERHIYSISARIESSDGDLIFISDTAYLVITDDLSTHDVEMQVVPVN